MPKRRAIESAARPTGRPSRGRSVSRMRSAQTVVRALQRKRPARLHGVEARQPRADAQSHRLGERLDDGARQRTASHLNHDAVEGGDVLARRSSRTRASRRLRSSGRWRFPDSRTAARRSARLRETGDSTGRRARPDRAGRRSVCAPSCARRSTTAGGASGGMKTCSARPAARATTAAASAALPQLAMASVGSGWADQADAFEHLQVDHDAHQVPGLVRAGHVAGLVLHPDAAVRGEPQTCAERRASREGRDPKSATVDARHLFIEAADQRDVVVVRHADARARRDRSERAAGTGRTGSARRREETRSTRCRAPAP